MCIVARRILSMNYLTAFHFSSVATLDVLLSLSASHPVGFH